MVKKDIFDVQLFDERRKPKRKIQFDDSIDNVKRRRSYQVSYKKFFTLFFSTFTKSLENVLCRYNLNHVSVYDIINFDKNIVF